MGKLTFGLKDGGAFHNSVGHRGEGGVKNETKLRVKLMERFVMADLIPISRAVAVYTAHMKV